MQFEESLYPSLGQGFSGAELLYESKSGLQAVCVYAHPVLGRVLTLDGVVQTTEADEFIYHEMMVHVPMLEHPRAQSVLIIGGGDGGILREVLKHPVSSVVMVEIDPQVVELSRQYLPRHSNGAFSDSRLELHFADGAAFVNETELRFDVILSDSTDPIGPAEALFESPFYRGVRRCFRDERSIFVAQSGVPFFQKESLQKTLKLASESFPLVRFYKAAVPTYYGGEMAFLRAGVESRPGLPLPVLSAKARAAKLETRYYSPGVHLAAFAVPPFWGVG